MKKIILLIIGVCFSSILFSQTSSTNKVYCKKFLIFIDAKLPMSSTKGYLEFVDSLGQTHVVDFLYDIGELTFYEEEYKKINLCSGDNDQIIMHLEYRDFIYKIPGYTDRLYIIGLSLFDIRAGSVILMIANTNKKKNEYVYDMYSDHITRWSSNFKAMKKSRELLEYHCILKKERKQERNIFRRIWSLIRD